MHHVVRAHSSSLSVAIDLVIGATMRSDGVGNGDTRMNFCSSYGRSAARRRTAKLS